MPAIITLLNDRIIDLLDPSPKDIFIEDIATGLSKLCRFNGQILDFYSVAQHCCMCVDLAKQTGIEDKTILLSILLHDASEAYCGDVIKPLKNIIGKKYENIESKITKSIDKKFKTKIIKEHDTIKLFDVVAYNIEKELKFNKNTIKCLNHSNSYKKFMKYFKELYE